MNDQGPIKGGGTNPIPSSNKTTIELIDNNVYPSKSPIELFIGKSYFKNMISLIPLFSLFLIVLSTNYYYFFNDSYSIFYNLISFCSGFSLFSLPAYFYIVYTYKFCLYSKFSLWGLLIYILINIVWFFIDLFFDVKPGVYGEIFESVSITVFLIISLIYFITEKNNK